MSAAVRTITGVAPLPEGRTGVRETEDVFRACKRFLRALGRRASGDVDALPYLAELADEADRQLAEAARACVAQGYSWGEVARVLGVSRQAAHKRFASAD